MSRPLPLPTSLRDDALVLQAHTASEPHATAAFEVLYLRYFSTAARFAVRFTQSREAAEDIVQSVFLRLWNRRDQFIHITSFKTYLLGAVRLEALQALRHHRLTERVIRHHHDVPAMGQAAPAPDAATDHTLIQQRFRCALIQLPERQRTALVLHWEQGLANREIAEILGIGAPAVSRLLTRAIESIRAAMEIAM